MFASRIKEDREERDGVADKNSKIRQVHKCNLSCFEIGFELVFGYNTFGNMMYNAGSINAVNTLQKYIWSE